MQKASPALVEATKALKHINKGSIQELKALRAPPADCVLVLKAVMICLGERKNHEWTNA